MHMADALLSPAVGGAMWAASAAAIAACSARLRAGLDDRKVPLMGVLGAFVFAAQMINFSVPGTGSSGHLGGALLLTILLGPCAAFLTIASVLVVQALFFADGGLLALGCNIFNIGFLPAFIVFPFFYKKLIGSAPSPNRIATVTVLSAVIALQLGSLAVVLETACSGISALPFSTFLLLMQPIHLAIGAVEGVVTLAVVNFVLKARPELAGCSVSSGGSFGKALLAFFACAVIMAGGLSSFASKSPDGLEWAIEKVTGKAELPSPQHGMHQALAAVQEKTAFAPDYHLVKPAAAAVAAEGKLPAQPPSAPAGSSFAGVVGTLLTLVIVFLTGFLLKKRHA